GPSFENGNGVWILLQSRNDAFEVGLVFRIQFRAIKTELDRFLGSDRKLIPILKFFVQRRHVRLTRHRFLVDASYIILYLSKALNGFGFPLRYASVDGPAFGIPFVYFLIDGGYLVILLGNAIAHFGDVTVGFIDSSVQGVRRSLYLVTCEFPGCHTGI